MESPNWLKLSRKVQLERGRQRINVTGDMHFEDLGLWNVNILFRRSEDEPPTPPPTPHPETEGSANSKMPTFKINKLWLMETFLVDVCSHCTLSITFPTLRCYAKKLHNKLSYKLLTTSFIGSSLVPILNYKRRCPCVCVCVCVVSVTPFCITTQPSHWLSELNI